MDTSLQVLGPPDFNRSSIFEAVPQPTAGPPLDANLRHLLRVALLALKDEDAALARAFAQAPGALGTFHERDNQGLAYWVYETTLVYTILKAWLPLVPVQSERDYEDGSHRRADLVVYQEPAVGAPPRWVFEAKWWNAMTTKACAAVAADARKLRDWPNRSERYLLTFWWSHLDRWETDRVEALTYIRSGLPSEAGLRETPEEVYVGAFPTTLRPVDDPGGAYFGLSVLRVTE